ncbi:hypothetical protein [Methylobacter sp. YRD-M1]|uniref:hypothetical protein n=1 Tax=Methylobacter sp. YRD-M1 TaxID=2911520 RepID=UPI00227D4DC6|nr:hypothetical protein [Methylobacter sp. YRD-M1]WAK01872.1 hypothetical protein LZ558_18965 [Methylobacter sp. YRD-M1]
MAIISYNNIATIGTVKDINHNVLPSDDRNGFAWTDSQNFRFKDGVASTMPGYEELITPSVTPYFTTRIQNNGASYYVYAGLNKIYTQYSGSQYNITRQSAGADVNYAADTNYQWNVAILNGLPVFNNGTDIPQAWTTISQGQRLVNLSGWPTNYKASVIRSFKAYLIALDVTNATPTRNQNLVKWSAAALPGALPTSWDNTNPALDAGEMPLADSDGYLVDCLPLNDYNVVYKNTSTYLMSYVGGNNVFSFKKVFPNVGMLAKNCAASFEGKHFVVTTDDVIVHDGFTYQSVIDGKNRKTLFNNMNNDSAQRTFVVPNYENSEMWVCYPSGSSTYPNNALIYNYKTGAWFKRLLPETSCITCGFVDITSNVTWASMDTTLWKDANVTWDRSKYNKNAWTLTMVVPGDNKIYLIDKPSVWTDNGQTMYRYLERENILINEDQNMKLIKRVWPKVTKVSGTNSTIDIYIGAAMTTTCVTNWQGPYQFNAEIDDKIDCFVTGRKLSIRFSSNTDINWAINGFDLEFDNKGKF